MHKPEWYICFHSKTQRSKEGKVHSPYFTYPYGPLHQNANLKLPNKPNRWLLTSEWELGNGRQMKSSRNTLNILSTPVPSSK